MPLNLNASADVKYRPEIDGLRAVAVSAVIANHFDKSLLPGGYLGVDIFFVISGYVITASLMKDESANLQEFLMSFYVRRIKRLLPPLLTCIVVTAFLGAVFIDPTSFKSSLRAGLYALVGLSNFYFAFQEHDYFASSAELNLFTHTWSLGVEEQFYLIYPALFWLVLCCHGAEVRKLQRFTAILIVLLILSWLGDAWLTWISFPGAYYLMPPRFWELGLGCLTFLAVNRRSTQKRTVRAGATTLTILAVFAVTVALALPPDWRLVATPLAVLATAVLISTLKAGSLTYRILTLKPVVAIGLLSYSLYLWHWSILGLSRWTIGISAWTAPLQIAAIFFLAVATYWLIERPLRRKQWSPKKLGTIGYGASAIVAAAGIILTLAHPLRGTLYSRVPASLAQVGPASLVSNRLYNGGVVWRARDCVLASNGDVGKIISPDICAFGADGTSRRKFLVIGNSFSAAQFEMYSVLAERNFGPVSATSSWGASPVPEMINRGAWSKANDYYWRRVVPDLVSTLRAGDVLIMINDLNGFSPRHQRAGTKKKLARLAEGLARISSLMKEKSVSVIFQSGNPFMREANCKPDMAKRQWYNFNDHTVCLYYSKAETLARLKPLNDILQAVRKNNPNFFILDLMPVLCAEDVCKMYNDDGIFLYRDEWSHMSAEANMLARDLFLSVVSQAIKRTASFVDKPPQTSK